MYSNFRYALLQFQVALPRVWCFQTTDEFVNCYFNVLDNLFNRIYVLKRGYKRKILFLVMGIFLNIYLLFIKINDFRHNHNIPTWSLIRNSNNTKYIFI